jgi:hypothetical protein
MASAKLLLALLGAAGATLAGAQEQDGAGGGACADTPPAMFRSVSNQTCLVTGISGMIGSYIAREVRPCLRTQLGIGPIRQASCSLEPPERLIPGAYPTGTTGTCTVTLSRLYNAFRLLVLANDAGRSAWLSCSWHRPISDPLGQPGRHAGWVRSHPQRRHH